MSWQFSTVTRGVAAKLAPRVPPTLGPSLWTRFVVEARMETARDLVKTDPRSMLRLIEPIADRAADRGTAWRLVAAAHERCGDNHEALAAVRRSIEAGERTVTTVLMRRRLAQRVQRTDEAAAALTMLLEAPPRNGKELGRAADALAGAEPELIRAYDAMIAGQPRLRKANRDRLDELLHEIRLAEVYADGAAEYRAELARVLAHSTRPLRVVVQALVRCRAWHEAAQFIATTPPNSVLIGPRGARAGFPAAEVGRAAALALAAGNANAASVLAARALVAKPDNAGFRATFDNARDQLSVARRGWVFPADGAASTPYEPAPRAVLSVLSQSLPIRSGGYATRSHGIITALASRGWQLRAVTRLGFPYDRWKASDTSTVPDVDHVDAIPYHRLLEDGVRQYPQYPLASYVDRFERGVRRLATEHRASLIHASSFYVAGMAGLTAARRLGLPFVYEMRGLEELMKVSRDPAFEGSDRHRFLDRLETGVAAAADRVFVITEALGREMARRGVSDDRIVVVPNGVHVDRFQPMERDRALEAELGLVGKTVIGYVGGLVDYEGLDILLEAVAGLKETRDDIHVVIVGDGPSQRMVHEQAARLRLGDMVTFTGRVPHDQVTRYLSLVDIAPFPRLPLPVCELISPIKPFESMAMAKAIVVSDVAALTEFVDDGVTGRVFRKGDPDDLRGVLEQLLDAPQQRRKLGRAAREWVVRERDWASVTTVVDQAYGDILGASGAARGRAQDAESAR
ncbi:glycosyltransferase [Jiangella asiatica]|uniref:Glycosyltransferase n=1 Tax=Jiangella asiatica TaxID=2530372 RepID=A0A4R5DU06_9ACTN|nr:glycosyltransferase [Jiangella asiatica]TDE15924.1 glycosyltransferase [Jiangella asiatica]